MARVWMILALSRLVSDTPALDRALGGMLSYWGRDTLVFYCVNAPIYPVLIPWLLSLVRLDTTSGNTLMRLACCLGAVLVNLAVAPRVSISATTYTCAHREHVARPVRDRGMRGCEMCGLACQHADMRQTPDRRMSQRIVVVAGFRQHGQAWSRTKAMT